MTNRVKFDFPRERFSELSSLRNEPAAFLSAFEHFHLTDDVQIYTWVDLEGDPSESWDLFPTGTYAAAVSPAMTDTWSHVIRDMEGVVRSSIERLFVNTALSTLSRRLEQYHEELQRVATLAERVQSESTRKESARRDLELNWELVTSAAKEIADELGFEVTVSVETSTGTVIVKAHEDVLEEVLDRSIELTAGIIDRVGLDVGRQLLFDFIPASDDSEWR